MASNGTEFSGKTVDEAIESGLQSLGLSRDDVNIDILNRGSRGILGFGSEPATVRISPQQVDAEETEEVAATDDDAQSVIEETVVEEVSAMAETSVADDSAGTTIADATEIIETAIVEDESVEDETIDNSATEDVNDEELARMAESLLGELLRLMDFEVDINASWQDGDETAAAPYLLLDIRGENLGALIGRRGETLSSIQYLLRLMINQQVKQWKNIVVDVERYKQRRVEQLAQLADRMARQVAESGRSVALEPMPGNERRIIHLTLRDDPDVFTESTGEGDRRKVNIFPRH